MKRVFVFVGMILLVICSYGQMNITTGNVNFRALPEIRGTKICVIPKGTVVSIVMNTVGTEHWTRIIYDGKVGYVHNDFLKRTVTDSKHNKYNVSSKVGVKYYKNSMGEKVQTPTHYDTAPAGATALCRDGTYSFSRSRRGTCSHHGGVERWL